MRRGLRVLGTCILLALAGCQSDPGPTVADPTATSRTTTSPNTPSVPTSPARSGPTSTSATTVPRPSRSLQVSVNPQHRQRTITGSGPRLIRVHLKGDFGLAADLDCSRCQGRVLLTQPGRGTPWVDQKAPVSGQYVVSIMALEQHPEVIVRAKGEWKLRLYDWNDSSRHTGAVRGTGSTIFYLDAPTSAITYDYTPADPHDSFSVRARGVMEREMKVFGTDEKARGERIKVDLPSLFIVHTRGTWTIRPKG